MTQSIDPTSIPQPELHGYLLAAVAPRPIAFASTIDEAGNVNLSPFSFFNVFSSNPPVMIFSPAKRGRDNTNKHTYNNIKQVPETVISIVNYPMVEQMSLASTEYAEGVNEFVKAGFTEVASEKIRPPRVGEAPVSFECVVDQVIELGDGPGAGNLVMARVVMIHVQEKFLNEAGKLDTTKLDLVGRMGGIWYTRATGDALFEIPKPLRTLGIGVDALPESIRTSHVLTGNNLGRLANSEVIPDAEAVESVSRLPAIQQILNNSTDPVAEIHRHAQSLLEAGQLEEALTVLYFADRKAGL